MAENKHVRSVKPQRGVLGAFDAGAPGLADTASVVTLVVVPELTGAAAARGNGPILKHAAPDRLAEAEGLARAIDLNVVATLLVRLSKLRPSTLFGSGKIEELKGLLEKHQAALVVVDHALAPIQQRNLEKQLGAKVIDRTGLILEIFGRRARTKEGQLQVELAHLEYQRSRLVRSWTHLERQRGGYGFLGGPGESQLEADRRLLRDRIALIKRELEDVKRTRSLHRAGRARVPYPVVAIVGYTNAGKSTLFNRLSGARVAAQDQLFATLDPTMREVRLAGGRRVILSDTVGFISELPTTLVAAFRATLEEVISADLILHVRDISHAETAAQRQDVELVLGELGVDIEAERTRLIEVWNKIDLVPAATRGEIVNTAERAQSKPLIVSAVTGEGLDGLLKRIAERLSEDREIVSARVPASSGRLLNWLYENLEVVERVEDGDDVRVKVRVDAAQKGRLATRLKQAGLSLAD
ncbi:MAG: GTPase HflX [Hyphomicrobiaceae bacterium]|nr:MAG: GTPase HflX [Hyphomicrobiaceae bacterium]